MVKKNFCILLSLVLLAGLTACGGKDPTALDAFDADQLTTPTGQGADGQETDSTVGSVGNEDATPENGVSTAAPSEPYVLVRETRKTGVTLYDYNEHGDLVQRRQLIQRGEELSWEWVTEYSQEYLDNGGRISIRTYRQVKDNVPAGTFWEYEEEYNANGLLIRKSTIKDGQFSGETVTYTYNGDGLLSGKSGQDTETPGTELPETYEYDEAGNLVKKTILNEDGSINGWWVYHYDENGYQTYEEVFDADGNPGDARTKTMWEYEYDAQGHIIDAVQHHENGRGNLQHYIYEYDEQGGLRKMTDDTYHIVYEYLPLSEYLQNAPTTP